MRLETYLEVTGRVHWVKNRYPVCTVRLSDPIDIYRRRVGRAKIREVLPPYKFEKNLLAMRQADFETDIEAICDEYMAFVAHGLAYSLQESTDPSPQAAFQYLERLFGEDRRLMFEAVRDSLLHYFRVLPGEQFDRLVDASIDLRNRESIDDRLYKWDSKQAVEARRNRVFSRFYLVTESLMLGRMEYRDNPHTYEMPNTFDKDSQIHHRSLTREIPRYLFNLYSYPFRPKLKTWPCPLASVRILQYLDLSPDKSGDETEMIEFLSRNFRYPVPVLKILLAELHESELLSPASHGLDQIKGLVQITPRGRHILERYATALEYVAVALEASALPRQTVVSDSGHLLLPIARYPSEEYVVRNKIVSAAKFVAVLQGIERVEEYRFNRQQSFKKRKREFDPFRITARIRGVVLAGILRVIDSAHAARKDNPRLWELVEQELQLS